MRRPSNDLAAAYQPRRVWASVLSIGWNLLFASLALLAGAGNHFGASAWAILVAALAYFAAYSVWNFPLELYFGYLEERHFGLAKEGVRAWAREWAVGSLHHGVQFLIGTSLLVLLQRQAGTRGAWVAAAAGVAGALFGLSAYFAADLMPQGLFRFEKPDTATAARLQGLAGDTIDLPPVVIYSAPQLRDFSGGLAGLGGRQVLLLSRSTVLAASDGLLRFILLHEAGHRRSHHLLLATLAGWAWVCAGLAVGGLLTPAAAWGTASAVPPLALIVSVWMALGEPVLAYLGRRLEYQADRYYLRHGGTVFGLQSALAELSARNFARTDALGRRQTLFHPLPSVANRIHAAGLGSAEAIAD